MPVSSTQQVPLGLVSRAVIFFLAAKLCGILTCVVSHSCSFLPCPGGEGRNSLSSVVVVLLRFQLLLSLATFVLLGGYHGGAATYQHEISTMSTTLTSLKKLSLGSNSQSTLLHESARRTPTRSRSLRRGSPCCAYGTWFLCMFLGEAGLGLEQTWVSTLQFCHEAVAVLAPGASRPVVLSPSLPVLLVLVSKG